MVGQIRGLSNDFSRCKVYHEIARDEIYVNNNEMYYFEIKKVKGVRYLSEVIFIVSVSSCFAWIVFQIT